MAFTDPPSPVWMRALGWLIGVLCGALTLDWSDRVLIADCISEGCTPALEWRLLVRFLIFVSVSALVGWAVVKIMSRIFANRF